MMRWEYDWIALTHWSKEEREAMMAAKGLAGWELVAVDDGTAWFKRPLGLG